MAPARSWYGKSELKDAVLAHLDADHAAGLVSALQVGDEPARYWHVERDDLDRLRAALGIPRSVLAFGTNTGGIIEDEASARWLIERVRAFFRAVPVGGHVDWVVDELAARRLVDDAAGVITIVDDVAIARLVSRVAEALRHGLVDDALRAEVDAMLLEWRDEIPRQWQSRGEVDPRVYAHCHALTTAAHACAVPIDHLALGRTVHASLQHPWSTGSIELVREEFHALLTEAESEGDRGAPSQGSSIA